MRLIWGLALGSVLGSLVPVNGQVDWESTYETLNSCLLSAATCKDPTGTLVAGAQTKESCTQAGYTWFPAYESSAALEAASNAEVSRSSLERTRALYMAQLKEGALVKDVKASLPVGVVLGDYISCALSTGFVYLDGFPIDVNTIGDGNGLIGAPFAVPAKLKVSPFLSQYEAANPPKEGKRLQRRFSLSPASVGKARDVMSRWSEKHENRRRLMADGDSVDLQFHLNYAHNEDRHSRYLQEIGVDEEGGGVEVIASIPAGSDETAFDWLVADEATQWVEPAIHYETSNMDAVYVTQAGISLSGTDYTPKDDLAPMWKLGVHGEGEIVGIGDSGIDTDHCFFTDPNKPLAARAPGSVTNYPDHRKIRQYIAYVDGTEGEARGHGSHVAGSVAGFSTNGATSNVGDANAMKGMAYNAQIAFFDIGEAGSPAVYPPADLSATMFQPAKDLGARIHTNSWGGNINAYTQDSRSVDTFAFNNQDFLILFANGNSGPSPQGNVGTPATAKNALSVGASMNSDRSYGFIQSTCPSPASEECANNMAPFSSSGPAFDNRIKPDVSAPGMRIGSSNSQSTCDMMWIAGTSMATPVTAGNAALVRQFIREGRFAGTGQPVPEMGYDPMGALIKAVMVNGADLMTGSYDTAAATLNGAGPDAAQGHGRTNLANTLLPGGNTADRSTVLDGKFGKDGVADPNAMPTITQTGGEAEYSFEVSSQASNFAATVVWFDPPAATGATQSLINDLDLSVTDPNGKIWYPNGLSAPDKVNTVEKVMIPAESLVPGQYILKVSGASVPQGPQPYALALSAPLKLTASGAPDGSITDESGKQTDISNAANSSSGGDGPSATTIGIIGGVAVFVAGAAYVITQRNKKGGSNNSRAMTPASGPGMGGPGMGGPGMGGSGMGGSGMGGGFTGFGDTMRGFSQRFTSSMGSFGRPQQAAQSGAVNVPPGWSSAIDPASGETYWYNQMTQETTWDPPKY